MDILLSFLTLACGALTLYFAFVLWQKARGGGADLDRAVREEFRTSREEAARAASELRRELSDAQDRATQALEHRLETLRASTDERLRLAQESQERRTGDLQNSNADAMNTMRRTLDEKLRQVIDDQRQHLQSVTTALTAFERTQKEEQAKGRETLERKLREMQEGNERKLEEMRKTVDEQLHSTLEKRLGESFKLVSERLEAVQNGLGEMKSLATGVGDLKRVLTNVKERGTWGEYQLGAILEEILTPAQFARNVRPKGDGEVVEFAVRLPGRGGDLEQVWLPIDAKFPKENFERLLEASNRGDADAVREESRALGAEILRCAKDIQTKYIAPPATTDFAILFLPTEGLYAEVLRQPGLHDEIQRRHRVLVAGPTTLSAILSSLRIGFQTLVIEKRAHEVWTVLGAVKSEFGKFGEVLDKVKKQLNTAANTIDATATRTRAMQRKLKAVEELPSAQSGYVLGLSSGEDLDEPAADEVTPAEPE